MACRAEAGRCFASSAEVGRLARFAGEAAPSAAPPPSSAAPLAGSSSRGVALARVPRGVLRGLE